MAEDEAVQETNDEATACKRCAVELGYWTDAYVQCFMKSAERRTPDINRGYYVRSQGCYSVVKKFLSLTAGDCQIVSLGAGFDTLHWRLYDENDLPKCIYEVDFKQVVARKALSIRNKRKLNEALIEAKISSSGVTSKTYHLMSCDIRDTVSLHQHLLQAGIDLSLPTLFIAECVLVYLAPEESKGILQWVAKSFPSSVFLNYEPVNLDDRFGEVMRSNLKSRGCPLLGGLSCKTVADQKSRFFECGWPASECLTMSNVHCLLPAEDVRRVEKLEFLDEMETLHQLLDHYCFSWAVNDAMQLGLVNVGFGS